MSFKVLTAFSIMAAYGSLFGLATVCNDKRIIDSKDITTDSGHTIKMNTFTCSDIETSPIENSGEINGLADSLLKRDSRCTASICLCGVGCIFNSCSPVTQSIRPTDCQTLITSLQTNSGTFTIQAGDGIGFAFESCEYTLFATQGTQQCFSDMGNAAANIFAVCGASQQGSCKMTSGSLTAFADQISL